MSSMRKWRHPSRERIKGGLLNPHCICAYGSINITEYIQNSDISIARSVGVRVTHIILPCQLWDNPSRELYLAFSSWMEGNDVLLHEECEVNISKYGDRDYTKVYYFNKFKVSTRDDGGLIHFAFGELEDYEVKILRENSILYDRDEYDSHKDLDMLRIAYGIAKKYQGLLGVRYGFGGESGIFGIVPNLIESTVK